MSSGFTFGVPRSTQSNAGVVSPAPTASAFGRNNSLSPLPPLFGQGLAPSSRPATPFGNGGLQPAAGATEQIQNSGFTTTPTFGVSSAAIPPISITNDISKTPSVATHLVLPSVSETPFTGAPSHLYRGDTIKVIVGTDSDFMVNRSSKQAWGLSKDLISHYSHTLRDACNRERHATDDICITLPEDNPCIFELFVRWMLRGTYTWQATDLVTVPLNQEVKLDAQAWILGHRLRSTEFKNHAMNRIIDQYATGLAANPITPADVRYAFEHSAAKSKLRQFYLDVLPKHFKSKPGVSGEVAEWDTVMQEHQELRICFLHAMKNDRDDRLIALHRKNYMEVDAPGSNSNSVAAMAHQVLPAKRKADGVLIKKEATGA